MENKYQALVNIKEHNIALLYANYLTTLGINATVKAEANGFAVYCEPEKMPQAKAEFDAFIKQPYHPKYQQAAWQHGETARVSVGEDSFLTAFQKNFLAHAGVVTLVVFVLCWLVYIAMSLGIFINVVNYLPFYQSLSLDAFLNEPLRLIGPIFLHFSILHIVFNTMWWWQLGGSIEKALGKGVLINLLLISALFSNIGQYLVSGANFGGLSGVVYALVGFIWWFGWLAPEKGLSLAKPIVGFMLVWLMLGFVDLLPVNVANAAHLLGLISGCLFAVFIVKGNLVKVSD